MVYWDAEGGPRAFRTTSTHTPHIAQWEASEESGHQCLSAVAVYDDPEFLAHTRTQTKLSFPRDDIIQDSEFALERLVDPKNIAGKDKQIENLKYSSVIDESVQPQAHGVWWPVWLAGKTKTGWWIICWYQVLDGTWIVSFWWYADEHIHLLDARG